MSLNSPAGPHQAWVSFPPATGTAADVNRSKRASGLPRETSGDQPTASPGTHPRLCLMARSLLVSVRTANGHHRSPGFPLLLGIGLLRPVRRGRLSPNRAFPRAFPRRSHVVLRMAFVATGTTSVPSAAGDISAYSPFVHSVVRRVRNSRSNSRRQSSLPT